MVDNPYLKDFPESPASPDTLYKYVVPERVDVLEGLHIRFSPLLATNDDFEVRRTFRELAGPRMRAAFAHEVMGLDVDGKLSEALIEAGFGDERLKPLALALLRQRFGDTPPTEALRAITLRLIDQFLLTVNREAAIGQLLERIAGRHVALSLTEEPSSSTMWAYYAAEGRGFVVAFDTTNSFFCRTNEGKRRKLQQIQYFDGELGEALDDIRAAFISKSVGWSHEREWRLYAREEEADKVVSFGDQQIHLFAFPPEMVRGVYVGRRMASQTVDRIKTALTQNCPESFLRRLEPDRMKGRYVEVPI
ncbi:DUF2971 domain-containing protein [Microvirga flavescens]|uniref:DUF2971 domain-containing protein n=1 Tax=Microvirga flavescens TaxID=2249811 RepID=UPI000DD64590|nr:DUF2971 domain-containing protein [Microvirga flavescens]